MTASAINTASMTPTAGAGAANAAAGMGGNAAAGFDALLATLFPQAGVMPAPTGQAVINVEAGAEGSDDAVDGDAADVVEAGAEPTVGDAATALAASLIASQAAPAQTPVASKEAAAAGIGGVGHKDAKPAQPFTPEAPVAESVTAEAPAEIAGTPEANPPQPVTTPKAAAQPAAARDAAPPAMAAAADAGADLPPPPAQPASVAAEAPAETPAAASAMTAQADATATAAPPPRPTKAERAKQDGEPKGGDAVKGADAADKPANAKTAQGVAQAGAKNASDKVDAADAKAGETEQTETASAAETPDAQVPAEARAATQTSSSASHTTQGARATHETVANMAAHIVKKAGEKATRFDLELDPYGLGKVDVRLEIGANGRVTAAMTFENPQAAQDMKARASELQRMLEQAGFDLSGGMTFDVASDRGQQQQHQAWQDQAETNGRAFRGQAFRSALDTAGDAANAANLGALRLRRAVAAGVDLKI